MRPKLKFLRAVPNSVFRSRTFFTAIQFIMSSKRVLNAMEAKDWTKVKGLIVTTFWTPEKEHGVRKKFIADV